jgi:pSer/pThr/pTyr-binding forkhead associated (FHA) protein
MRRGPQPNQTFELTKDVVTIGRDIINDITISDPEVSRQHCRLIKEGDNYKLVELGSTNGTFIRGERITDTRALKPGDLIHFGETVILAYTVTQVDVVAKPEQATSITRPLSAIKAEAQATAQATSATPVPASSEAVAGRPAYVYTPTMSAEITPEAGRFTLFACGILTTLCVIGVFMSIILIDASNRWEDVPLIGSAFSSAPVKMQPQELERLSMDVPDEWETGKIDFPTVNILVASPEEVDAFLALVPGDYAGLFQQSTGLVVIVQDNSGDMETMLQAFRASVLGTDENGLLSEVLDEKARSIDIDGEKGLLAEITARRPSSAETPSTIWIAVARQDDSVISFIGVTSDEDRKKNLEIFEYILDNLKLK